MVNTTPNILPQKCNQPTNPPASVITLLPISTPPSPPFSHSLQAYPLYPSPFPTNSYKPYSKASKGTSLPSSLLHTTYNTTPHPAGMLLSYSPSPIYIRSPSGEIYATGEASSPVTTLVKVILTWMSAGSRVSFRVVLRAFSITSSLVVSIWMLVN